MRKYKSIVKIRKGQYTPYFITSIRGSLGYVPQVEVANPTFRTIGRIFRQNENKKRHINPCE